MVHQTQGTPLKKRMKVENYVELETQKKIQEVQLPPSSIHSEQQNKFILTLN